MTATELRALTHKDLQQKLSSVRKDLHDARLANAAGELPNPQVLAAHRHDVARILMVINEKQAEQKKEKDNA